MLPKHFNLVVKSQIMVNSLFSKSKKKSCFLVKLVVFFFGLLKRPFKLFKTLNLGTSFINVLMTTYLTLELIVFNG